MNSDDSKKSMLILLLAAILMAIAVVPVIGCSHPEGPLRVTASGHVLLDGVPLKHGLIRFIPAHGPAASTQIRDGIFMFSNEPGPVPGEHRVEIEATDYQGFVIDDEAAFTKRAEESRGVGMPRNPVPAVYNVNSKLKHTVSSEGQNRFVFELQTS